MSILEVKNLDFSLFAVIVVVFSFVVPLHCSSGERLAERCRFLAEVWGLAMSDRTFKYVKIFSLLILFWLLVPSRALAGEPIRLLVIPYQAGWGSQRIPINQFSGPAMPPPPPPLAPQQAERLKPTGVESDSSDDAVDDDWLMDG